MFGDTLTLADAFLISGFSILAVFLILLAISYMIDLNAWVIGKLSGTKKDAAAVSMQKTEQHTQASASAKDGASVVLATAAIAAYLGTDTDDFVVRRITHIPGNAWASNGLTDSMR